MQVWHWVLGFRVWALASSLVIFITTLPSSFVDLKMQFGFLCVFFQCDKRERVACLPSNLKQFQIRIITTSLETLQPVPIFCVVWHYIKEAQDLKGRTGKLMWHATHEHRSRQLKPKGQHSPLAFKASNRSRRMVIILSAIAFSSTFHSS